ncbi:hypothetical protein AB0H73_18515 [Streptomyces olivoreticuli]
MEADDWTISQGVAPNCLVEVDPGDGSGVPERWTGATWNQYVAARRRSGEKIAARVVHVL